MKDRLFQVWFSLRCGVANKEFAELLDQYGSPYNIFMADEDEIASMPCSDRLKRAFMDKNLDESYRILNYCENNGVGLLFWTEKNYPSSLRVLRDPPSLLYFKGKLPDFAHFLCISIVGTRKMSEYGKKMAYKIGYELAAARTVVVSGMALGNDSVAAAGALAAHGTTVAILGSGIDIVYPPVHKRLMEEIIDRGGVVMSEYPPSTPPEQKNFPIRNRIISGLSQGTVVVEADMRSGALITAKTAILQGRDVYAVPGNVGDVNTSGTNKLIHDGAIMVLGARDILENYTFLYRDTIDTVRLLKAERTSDPNDDFLEMLGVYSRVSEEEKRTRTAEKARTTPSPSVPKPPRVQQVRLEERGKEVPRAKESARREGDKSEQILLTLTETQRKIFTALPLDRAVPVDYLTREGFSLSDVIASMTILEIKGLVVSLPGGLYSRK